MRLQIKALRLRDKYSAAGDLTVGQIAVLLLSFALVAGLLCLHYINLISGEFRYL
jgi:hypothetical protein